MKEKTPEAAPSGSGIDRLYKEWRKTHVGNLAEFRQMLLTPCAEREEFLAAHSALKVVKGVAVEILGI